MGTMIQRYKLSESDFRNARLKDIPVRLQGNNDLISLTRPDVLREIHRTYLEAGADLIETNTFNAQRISQADYLTEAYVADMNREAVRIAREEADRMTALTPAKPRFVAASVGPTNKTLSMSPDVDNPAFRALTFDELSAAYEEQMTVLSEGGADVFLIETIFDTLNAKAALEAARKVKEKTGRSLPVMLSMTIADASGRMLAGQTPEAFLASVCHNEDILSVGFNCSFGAADMRPYLRRLAEHTPYYISAHPNAGLPDEEGRYTETPASMAEAIRHFVEDGSVNIVGGCCGSTPEHIAAMARAVEGRAGRKCPSEGGCAWLAGLDAFSPAPGMLMHVGERLNVAGSRKFLRLIKEKQYDEALAIARKQVRDGAMLLDINMDDGMLDTRDEMTRFLRLMASDPEVAAVPWMVDSSRFEVVEAALKCVQGKCVVNSISLKEGESVFLEHARLIRRYGTAVVVMAFDEEGQATTYERKIEVCERAYRLLVSEGFPPCDIIFDPNILTVATGMKEHDRYALDYLEACGWITRNLPGVHVSGGVSNLSFAFRGNNCLRESMHAVFLYHALQKGMDMAILNPASKVQYGDISEELKTALEDVLLCRRDDAAERLSALAQRMLAEKESAVASPENADSDRRKIPLEDRLADALRTGDNEHLGDDIAEALEVYDRPADIIEGPLMAGMKRVGELFGEGKMFLPQVVKSARTMKEAVALIQPSMEREKRSRKGSNGRYVLATVKGDVHDIGKNIVGVVLGCNNFEVVDLGVMVPADKIVKTLVETEAEYIALSGLITPSLEEMCRTVEAMERAGIRIPVFIGGATTSPLHTALKIAPLYSGPVFHVKDASANVVLAMQLKGAEAAAVIARNREEQARMVSEYRLRQQAVSADGNACSDPKEQRLQIDWNAEDLPLPTYLGCRKLAPVALSQVRPFINWIYFFNLWKVRPGSPEAEAVKADAERMLDDLDTRHYMLAEVAFYRANGTADSIIFHEADGQGGEVEIPTPRSHPAEGPALALCDFVAPEPYRDHAGAFAVTVQEGFMTELENLKNAGDTYRSLLMQAVGDRLAEATAEWVHREVRTRLWGYAPDEDLSLKDLARAAYRGIRPAVGYPSLPDQKLLFNVARMLDLNALGIRLTENAAMYPQSTVCALLLASQHATYFCAH